jgi:TP901 family phage tail tape measure protein
MVFTGGGIQEEVAVQISGDGTGLTETLDSAEAGLMSLSGAVTALGGALVGLAGVMGGRAVNAARAFEQQMVELEKVTNPEIAREMGDSIQEMAERIPLAQRELADIASQAGRLGIEGVDNIEEFTRVTSEMAVATDLAAADAADAFARITQLTGVPIDNVEELGSAINALSNNMATTSSEITDSVLRSGAAMSQLGLSAEEILGLSATLNEVSESSQRAGTRLRRVAQELLNPRNVEGLAGALGLSAEEFRTMREEAPLQLIRQMVSAFESGGESANTLRQSLSTASRQAIAGLAQNTEGLTAALETSNEQFEDATSLSEEFAAANDTFNAQLTRTQNKLRNVAIETGETLLPHLSRLLGRVNEGIDAFDRLNSRTDGMAGTVAILGLAIGGIVAVLAGLVSIVGGPVVAAVGLLTGLVAGLAAAWESNFLGIRDHTRDAITRIQAILERLEPAFEASRGILRNFRAAWDLVGDDIITILSATVDGILGILTAVIDAAATFVTIVAQLLNGDFAGALETFVAYWRRLFGGILEYVDEWGDDLIAAVLRIVAGVIEGAGSNLESFLSGIPGVDIGQGDLTPDRLVGGLRDQAARVESRGARSIMRGDRGPLEIRVNVEGDTDVVRRVSAEEIRRNAREENLRIESGAYRG